MASSDYSWLQLPTWSQLEELAFDSSYNQQAKSISEFPYDNSLFSESLTTPYSSLNTMPSSPNNPITQDAYPEPGARRQRRNVNPPPSESTTGSTSP
ncbi:hypothetical protein V491_08885, partial [Pseudogymnoascus sp. VKM F-3775]